MKTFDSLGPKMEEAIKEYRDLGRATNAAIPDLRRTNDEILVTVPQLGKLGERLDVLTQTNQDKLTKAVDNLNESFVRINTLFNDENQAILPLFKTFAGSENLDSISRNTDALIKESRLTIQRVGDSVKQADDVLDNLQKATKPMAERSTSVMKNLDESTIRLNRALNEADVLLRSLNQENGTLRLLATDPMLYNNINDAACMLARIMLRVDKVLKDVEVFADKIARHPESLGIGGAIRPSAGIK